MIFSSSAVTGLFFTSASPGKVPAMTNAPPDRASSFNALVHEPGCLLYGSEMISKGTCTKQNNSKKVAPKSSDIVRAFFSKTIAAPV
ncbi:MAG: hypothetical protein ABIQ31_22675 [Ferruginibacter sp.]